MNIVKLVLIAIVAIVVFQFIENKEDDYDQAIMLPLDTKILAFGDSITSGYRVEKDKSYPSQLAVLLNAEVINAGVSGEQTKAGLRRLPALLERYKPQILIITHGGNDILRRKSVLVAKENIARMIKLAQAKKIHVVLVGVPEVGVLTLRTAEIYFELASEYDVPLEDSALQEILNDDALKVDQIHPNEEGYRILSNKIATIVTDTYVPNF